MAGNGLSIVEGINEIVETIGDFPMDTGDDAPGTTGTSIYSRAQQILEREAKRILAEGWPENTEVGRRFTLNETTFVVDADDLAGVLRVQGSGPDRHRDLVLKTHTVGEAEVLGVYDANIKGFALNIPSGEESGDRDDVFLDCTFDLDFEDITPLLQDVIVAKAKMMFQRRLQGNPSVDQALQQEYIMANRAVGRNEPYLEQNFNIQDDFQAMRRGGTNDRAGIMNRGGGQQQQ